MGKQDPGYSDAIPTVVTLPFVVEAVVFLCGAVDMVLELVGSRLLAPYFGNSIFVWTSLIGVMLGFLALGNYLGGRLADRHLSVGVLFWILVGASASVSVVAFTEGLIIPALAQGASFKVESVASAVALFAVPSTVLGMVAPYGIRLKMHAISDSGSTVGSLYALSTLGSIVGTFAAGFWLIALLGSHSILIWVAAVPAALSLLFLFPVDGKRVGAFGAMLLVLIAAALFSRPSIDSFDTQYGRYFIRRGTDSQSGRPVVALALDVRNGAETIVYADNGEPFTGGYWEYFDLALKLAPEVKKTLLVGGGAFAYPRHQFAQYPDSTTDAVEIDGKLVTVARQDFALKDDPRQNIIVEDGRTFLDKTRNTYDVILLDAFKSRNSVPYQLTTRESMKLCYDHLGDHGVVAMNLIASLDGPGHQFLEAEYATLKTLFPRVVVFAVTDPKDRSLVQNFSLIAFKDASDGSDTQIQHADPKLAATLLAGYSAPAGTKILTDDYAPVDQYIIDL